MSLDQLQVVDLEMVGESFTRLSSCEAISYEATLLTSVGHEVPVQVYAREVSIDGVSHLQWILRDITERKNLDQLRNDLISMIYHDLRSPLGNVVSTLDVLEAMLPLESDPTLKSLLNVAIRSTERIQRLTNSLLDMRRLEAGQPVGNRQHVDPSTLAHEAVEAVSLLAENKNQEIVISIPADLPPVWIDADMIRRVLINLLENAAKYTPAGSKIYMDAQPIQNGVQMCVQDTGQGIPPSEHERIFDKFSRLHTEGEPRGLGLGLAYCRLAVEGHGGHIWIENIPESGACFKFTLPTTQDS
jgi:K+-sensing histidine kinase KdpD